jgi:hypothetical protein
MNPSTFCSSSCPSSGRAARPPTFETTQLFLRGCTKLGETRRHGPQILGRRLKGAEKVARYIHGPIRLATQLRREEVEAYQDPRLDQDGQGGQRNENGQKILIDHGSILALGEVVIFDRLGKSGLPLFNRFGKPLLSETRHVLAFLNSLLPFLAGSLTDAG